MSHKTSPARRAAFFAALRETGNQTLACERARVSRSWMTLQRASDPGFRAEMEAAVAEAKEKLRWAPIPDLHQGRHARDDGCRPPRKWAFQDGEELVVRGTRGRRVQVARARLHQWTPRVEARFLSALIATCNVKAACAMVGMTPASAYAHRKRWERFAALWDEAVAEGFVNLEVALIQNAQNLFSADDLPPPEIVLGGMDVAQAIHLVHMHKHGVLGLGKAPGKSWRPPPTLAALKPGMLKKLWAWEVARQKAGTPVRRP